MNAHERWTRAGDLVDAAGKWVAVGLVVLVGLALVAAGGTVFWLAVTDVIWGP